MRRTALLAATFALAACAAQQSANAVQPAAPGFLMGLWHGFIFAVAWLLSLFTNNVAVYAVPNNGGWYDFGFLLGLAAGPLGARKSRIVYKDRVINVRAQRIPEPSP